MILEYIVLKYMWDDIGLKIENKAKNIIVGKQIIKIKIKKFHTKNL